MSIKKSPIGLLGIFGCMGGNPVKMKGDLVKKFWLKKFCQVGVKNRASVLIFFTPPSRF
jgi:hypothetical protein